MKNFIIILFFCLFLAGQAVAGGLSDAYTTVTKTVTKAVPESLYGKNCPVYTNTPRDEVKRATWEIDARLNGMDSPSQGGYQFSINNIDARLTHNISPTLYAYLWAGNRNIEKDEYEGSAYTKEWESRMVFAGFGVYITPVFKIFGGFGIIWVEDSEGNKPDLKTPAERGIGYDVPIGNNGNKLSFEYRFIEAKMKDKPPVEEVLGDGGFSTVSIAYVVPL